MGRGYRGTPLARTLAALRFFFFFFFLNSDFNKIRRRLCVVIFVARRLFYGPWTLHLHIISLYKVQREWN